MMMLLYSDNIKNHSNFSCVFCFRDLINSLVSTVLTGYILGTTAEGCCVAALNPVLIRLARCSFIACLTAFVRVVISLLRAATQPEVIFLLFVSRSSIGLFSLFISPPSQACISTNPNTTGRQADRQNQGTGGLRYRSVYLTHGTGILKKKEKEERAGSGIYKIIETSLKFLFERSQKRGGEKVSRNRQVILFVRLPFSHDSSEL
jgi:hypothetical protein